MEIYKKNEELPEQTNLDAVTSSIVISTSVSLKFWRLAKKNNIKWSDALRTGISLLLAEKGYEEYDNNLNIYRKMKFYQHKVEEYANKVAEFEEKQEKLKEKN